MKKLRINVKRLSLTLGVLGTSAGLIGLAAWQKVPLSSWQHPADATLVSEVSADQSVAMAAVAPPPAEQAAPMQFDPIVDVGNPASDDRDFTKAGKHGHTPMMVALEREAAPVDGWMLGAETRVDPARQELAAAVSAAAAAAPAATPVRVAHTHRRRAGGAAATSVRTAAAPGTTQATIARRDAASDLDLAPTRAEEQQAAVVAEVGEAHYDSTRRVLSVPYNGVLQREQLAIHRLGDGRAYIDLPGAKPIFSGSRSENVFEGPISRWAMAAQSGPGGRPVTRVAFRLNSGARPRLDLDGGELRIALTETGRAVIHNPVAPKPIAQPAAPAPIHVAAAPVAAAPAARISTPRIGEAHYDTQAGTLRLPVSGRIEQSAISLHRLGDDQAYLDIAGAAPNFNGLRSGRSQGQALARWTMAGIPDAGFPLTRLFVKLSRPGELSARVGGGEIRLSVTDLPPVAPLEQVEDAAPAPASGEADLQVVPAGERGQADPVPAN
ncbi:MAG: hypothetical protein VKP62_15955 [Candidatus Sericytochromatia bacterium]|nr:hypothetical protein [Candidatus Sericytochromatia bacterium]